MAFWVYILQCADGSYYTGHTENLELRVAQHNQKVISGYTSTRLPVKLVFSQPFSSRVGAIVSERQIKGWRRTKKEAMMKGDWAEVSKLSHGSTSSPRTD